MIQAIINWLSTPGASKLGKSSKVMLMYGVIQLKEQGLISVIPLATYPKAICLHLSPIYKTIGDNTFRSSSITATYHLRISPHRVFPWCDWVHNAGSKLQDLMPFMQKVLQNMYFQGMLILELSMLIFDCHYYF